MSNELYEIDVASQVTADLIETLIKSLAAVASKHGLKPVQGRPLWIGDIVTNRDSVNLAVGLDVQDAKMKLMFPDRTIPRERCRSVAELIGSEIFRELAASGVDTPRIMRRKVNIVSMPCG